MTAVTLDTLPPILTVKETADLLRVHLQTVYLMIERGELHAARVGMGKRSIRIERDVILKLMRGGQ